MQANFEPSRKPPFKTLVLCTLVLYLLGIAACVLGAGISGALNPSNGQSPFSPNQVQSLQSQVPALVGGAVGILMMLGGLVCYAMALSGMWGVVQDGRARLSPAAGTALAIIPIVNLVGIFFGFHGLSLDLTRVARERGLNVQSADGLSLAACICWVCGSVMGCIPLIGCIFGPAALVGTVLWFVSLFRMASTATLIDATPPGEVPPPPETPDFQPPFGRAPGFQDQRR